MTETIIEPGSLPLRPDRREAFAQHYSRKANATWAAKEAGYTQKAAHAQGFRLLRDVAILERITFLKAERWKSLHMGPDETLAEIAKVARFNLGSMLHLTPQGEPYIDLSLATPDDLAALAEATIEDFTDGRGDDARDVRRVKIKAHSKIAALTLAAKAHGLLIDKAEVSVTGDFAGVMDRALRRAKGGKADDGET